MTDHQQQRRHLAAAGIDPDKAQEIYNGIRNLLAGQTPAMQGFLVVQLAAMWLAGHDAELRQAAADLLARNVERLVPSMAIEIDRRRQALQQQDEVRR